MSRLLTKHPQNTGSGLRWVIHTSEPRRLIPTKRGLYVIGLRNLVLTGFKEQQAPTSMAHICITPAMNVPTYLLGGQPISAVKTFTVDSNTLNKDFGQEMEYFTVDLSYNEEFTVKTVDNLGRDLKLSGSYLFELHKLQV